MTVGSALVLVTPPGDTPGSSPVDVSCLVDTVTINHGRTDSSGQPEASSCSLDLDMDPGLPVPPELDVGSWLTVQLDHFGTISTRFHGRVTDLALGWDDDGEDTPEAGIGTVVAVGQLADFGRRVVGDAPFPQELDGARVARVAALAGYQLDPIYSDPGTVQIVPRDVDAQPALEIMQEVADSSLGIVWQSRAGDMRYADSNHRRGGVAPVLVLDACDIDVSPAWQRNTDGLLNDVTVAYGVAPDGGEQPTYRATSAQSIAKWGTYAASFSSVLAALADAQAMAGMFMARNSSPVWVLSAIPLTVTTLDRARTDQLLTLDMHNLVQITGLPVIGSAPTSLTMWVEGWKEELSYGDHALELIVSGYCRTAPAPRWDELDPGRTWDTQGYAWDDATCLGPPLPGNTWGDIPATARWDLVAPAVTWDTYKPLGKVG